MTTSIPLDQLPNPGQEWRRDQWGRYLIVPPKGGRPVGYTRVTTVAGTLDDGGGLASWKAAMTAGGIIKRRGLRAQWEALLATYQGDPWYSGEEGKAAAKALVEECAAAGGANDRREMGTSLHTITALIDVGRKPAHLTEETERDILAYVDGMAAAGVVIPAGMVELTVVLDSHQVAGTFDRLATVPGFDLPLIADLKTGADLSYSWGSIAVQLAAYSRADAIYTQGAAADGSKDTRTPMPAVEQSHGLIMWLNAGTGMLELHLVDLDVGWEAFGHSMWTRGWRKAKPSVPLSEYVAAVNLADTLEASVKAVEAAKATAEPFDTAAERGEVPAYTHQLRAWLQERIDTAGRVPAARTDLAASWPPGMPALRASTAHTPEQLAAIETILDGVETRCSLPLHGPRPTTDAVGTVLHLFPGSRLITNDKDTSA